MIYNIKYLSSIQLENSQTRYRGQHEAKGQMTPPYGHGRNPNHAREQGQRK